MFLLILVWALQQCSANALPMIQVLLGLHSMVALAGHENVEF